MRKRAPGDRSKQVNIRLTDDEATALAEAAESANLDFSSFVRRAALERIGRPHERRTMSAQTAAIIRDLTAIGTALLRVVRLYETHDSAARSHLEKCLADVEAAILRV